MLSSRRSFLRSVMWGTAAGAVAQLPMARIAGALHFEPPRSASPGGPILLNSNENAYGPSKRTLEAIRTAASSANRYPRRHYEELSARIAAAHRVKPEQVVLGCGSTEILRMAAPAFLDRTKQLIQAAPTFEAIQAYSSSVAAAVLSLPLTAEFAHDLDAMLGRTGGSTGLIYICNPNNPTGSITPRKDLEGFIAALSGSVAVLIDEAYHHYAEPSSRYVSFLDAPLADERVVVTRTFSKVYGLAGLRLGYAVASPAVAARLRGFATKDNVNSAVTPAALAALDDQLWVNDCVRRNADARQEFFNQAQARGLKPIDSHTNFVMMNAHHPATEVIEHFRKNNILIGRPFPPMDTYVRVSLGTPDEMKIFWRAWDLLPYPKLGHH